MKKAVSKSTIAVFMAVCLLATAAFAAVFGTGAKGVQASASTASMPIQDENLGAGLIWYGYNLDNLLPFKDFAASQGYVIEDESSLNEFAENFSGLYDRADGTFHRVAV